MNTIKTRVWEISKENRTTSSTYIRFAILTLAITLSFLPLHAQLATESLDSPTRFQIVAFGDSLLDAGTYSPIADTFFGGGRFTTNPSRIFVQDVALHYGDILTPAYLGGFGLPLLRAGGFDYAQGGSQVTIQPSTGFSGATTIPVKEQLADYLSVHKRFDSHQIVFFNGGADDIFFNLTNAAAAGTPAAQQAALQAISQAAVDLVGLVATAFQNGAVHVVLMNIPDIGTTPEGIASGNSQQLTQVAQLFNATLEGALQQQGLLDKVVLLDFFDLIDGIITNFQANGFKVSNTGMACNLPAEIARATQLHLNNPSQFSDSLFCSPKNFNTPDADQTFMFADTVHPTTHLSKIVTPFVVQLLEASGIGR